MKLDDLRSIDQLRDFLEGTQAVAFTLQWSPIRMNAINGCNGL